MFFMWNPQYWMDIMKTFEVIRNADFSGVSGTGLVLRGVVFPDGQTIIQWCSKSNVNSLGIYSTFEDFEFVHITSHPDNGTEIKWTC